MAISVRGSGDTSAMKKKNGVGTGNTQLENLTVTGITTVSEPVNDTDAVTKKYVDDALENVIYGDGEEPVEDAEFVQSVNGKTGQVTLRTSDLTNDSGFITVDEVPSGLPAVTTEDASKVLTVDSTGEWAASDLPNEVAYCTPSSTNDEMNAILTGLTDGTYKTAICAVNTYNFYTLKHYGPTEIVFVSPEPESETKLNIYKIKWTTSSGWSSSETWSYATLPVTYPTGEAPTGQFLQYNGSSWTAAEVPTVTVDTALSATSENPVQNKVINTALNSIELVATDDGEGNVTLSISL